MQDWRAEVTDSLCKDGAFCVSLYEGNTIVWKADPVEYISLDAVFSNAHGEEVPVRIVNLTDRDFRLIPEPSETIILT